MRIRDMILLGLLFAWLILVIAFWIRQKKRGGCAGCVGGCSGCEKSCKMENSSHSKPQT